MREAEDVAVGILEPGDFGAARRSPDSLRVLAGKAVTLEGNAFGGELRNSFNDIRNLPAENRKLLRLESGRNIGDAEHDAVGVKRKSEIVLAENAQAENAFVKRPRFVGVEGGRESHDFVRAEHSVPLVILLQNGRQCNAAGRAAAGKVLRLDRG